MSTFLVRVELFGNPTWHTYDQLHAAMERKGFSKTIQVKTGTVYDLPTATYYRESTSELSSINNDAKSAADSVWRNNGVVTAQTNGIIVDGLKIHQGGRRFGYG